MKIWLFLLLLLFSAVSLLSAQDLYLNGLNEVSYIYRTAEDSLNSHFRDAFSFSVAFKDFSLGMKFLAELPRYSTEESLLLEELIPNRLSTQWTERWLEFERDNLILRGGTISENFCSGMVFRAWEDVEFDQDNRLDGFLARYSQGLKLKALYGALPNLSQPSRNDIAYGVDGEFELTQEIDLSASALTMRTLNALGVYNQQDVFGGRVLWGYDFMDGIVEYAVTSMFKNSGANYEGSALNAAANFYLKPAFVKYLTLGAGYKLYDRFNYRLQDLKTFNYHNETLADNQVTGEDEEGLQGLLALGLTDALSFNANYGEAWDSSFQKRMSDLYTSLEWLWKDKVIVAEYGQIEKLDKSNDTWQQEIIPSLSLSQPLGEWSLTGKAQCKYIEKVFRDDSDWHYEPLLQLDLGKGKLSASASAESRWQTAGDITKGNYWANCEIKYALFSHTDITLFAGRESGGKVCRNGICRFVAPFEGLRLEAVTRF